MAIFQLILTLQKKGGYDLGYCIASSDWQGRTTSGNLLRASEGKGGRAEKC